jgi:hypothetical protein
MVLVKATKDSEAGVMPSTELLEAMGKYNEELVAAGIMLTGEGLKPLSEGKRVAFDGVSRAKWQSVPFQDLLQAELEPYDDGTAKRITLAGPAVELPSELAVPIGMAVHEQRG